jgi:uncharacterized membrane protein
MQFKMHCTDVNVLLLLLPTTRIGIVTVYLSTCTVCRNVLKNSWLAFAASKVASAAAVATGPLLSLFKWDDD